MSAAGRLTQVTQNMQIGAPGSQQTRSFTYHNFQRASMRTRLLGLTTIWILYVILGCNHTQKLAHPVADEAHIKQLILRLPQDSQTRFYLERGDRGDGVHVALMDDMKRLGVKRATILLDFTWIFHPVGIHVQRLIFFSAYDRNCSQIADTEQIQRIEKSGLEQELKEFAIAQTAQSDWTYFERRPRALHGTAAVEVADDEWIPVLPPNLRPLGDGYPQFRIHVDGDVKHLQETLKTIRPTQDELNGALVEASASLDDECSIKALIDAGANPNFQNVDQETPLMSAATTGLVHNVEALLKAGADPRIKNVRGETALDFAEKRGRQNIVSILRQNRPAGG
jgi:hypothetical protein